jgi:hypothetical protein
MIGDQVGRSEATDSPASNVGSLAMRKYVSFEKVMDAADLYVAKLMRIRGDIRVFVRGRKVFAMQVRRGKVPLNFLKRFIEWCEEEE